MDEMKDKRCKVGQSATFNQGHPSNQENHDIFLEIKAYGVSVNDDVLLVQTDSTSMIKSKIKYPQVFDLPERVRGTWTPSH